MTDDLKQQVARLVTRENLLPDDIRQLDKRAVPILIDSFNTAEGDLKNLKCRQALLSLGVLGTEEAVEFMIATVENSEVDDWLRKSAVQFLGLSDNPKALVYLESVLSNPMFGFRKNAVLGLGVSKAPGAVKALRNIQKTEPDARIRSRIENLLEKEKTRKAGDSKREGRSNREDR
jgi:HEAT repeat protein